MVDYSTTSNFRQRLIRTSLICDLLFADDAALVDTSFEEAKYLVDQFSKGSKDLGLTISIKKMEVVHQPVPTPNQVRGVKQPSPVHEFPHTPITINVKTFKYLGSSVNLNASLDDEIINRIAKATNAFGKLCHSLWDKRGKYVQKAD